MTARPTYIPRRDRMHFRATRMAAEAKAAGASALDCALAHIEGATGRPMWINSRKQAVERLIAGGPADEWTRRRFISIACEIEKRCGSEPTLDQAIAVLIALKVADDRRAAIKNSRPAEPIAEAVLILRWLRQSEYARAWPQIFQIATTPLYRSAEVIFILPARREPAAFLTAAE